MSERVLIAGGGLSGCLTALACATYGQNVLILEREPVLAGNKTWCFHEGDLSGSSRAFVAPLIQKTWREHEVRFPGGRRKLSSAYHALTSAGLRKAVEHHPRITVRTGVAVRRCDWTQLELSSGGVLQGSQVWDARSSAHFEDRFRYQKFLGLEIRFRASHRLTSPILMDATIDQIDGFRFMYVLPWDSDTALIEDTRYSDTPDVNAPEFRQAIRCYAQSHSWQIAEVLREEVGCLPLPLYGHPPSRTNTLGAQAGLFHPTTSYSLPYAIRSARWIAAHPDLRGEALSRAWQRQKRHWQSEHSRFHFLNRLLFLSAPQSQRRRVLERFYNLPLGVIERFYANRLTVSDWSRILLWGKPPISPLRALAALLPQERHG